MGSPLIVRAHALACLAKRYHIYFESRVLQQSNICAEEEKAIEERLSPLQPGQRRKRRLSAADEELMRRAQAMDASPVTHGVQDR